MPMIYDMYSFFMIKTLNLMFLILIQSLFGMRNCNTIDQYQTYVFCTSYVNVLTILQLRSPNMPVYSCRIFARRMAGTLAVTPPLQLSSV